MLTTRQMDAMYAELQKQFDISLIIIYNFCQFLPNVGKIY